MEALLWSLCCFYCICFLLSCCFRYPSFDFKWLLYIFALFWWFYFVWCSLDLLNPFRCFSPEIRQVLSYSFFPFSLPLLLTFLLFEEYFSRVLHSLTFIYISFAILLFVMNRIFSITDTLLYMLNSFVVACYCTLLPHSVSLVRTLDIWISSSLSWLNFSSSDCFSFMTIVWSVDLSSSLI